MLQPYLVLGTIIKPQGVRGEVKLRHDSGDAERFDDLATVYTKNDEQYTPIHVLASRANAAEAYLTLEGVEDRDQADKLRGTILYVDRANARKLSKNEVFIVDLIGLQATDTEGKPIGTLKDVLQNGGVDVLVFSTPRGNMMAPFLKKLVTAIDVAAGSMVLDAQTLPEVALYENSDTNDFS